jgi:hypothetical protein
VAGGGVFYDRFQGNETFDMITNPPMTVAPTLNFGRLQDLGRASSALLAPFGLNAFLFEGDLPTVYNYNVGIQMKLPASFVLDLSYVGSQSRHLLERRNISMKCRACRLGWETTASSGWCWTTGSCRASTVL